MCIRDSITTEIQKGYYGRELDPARPGDPRDRQGFAYPVYVVFVLAMVLFAGVHTTQVIKRQPRAEIERFPARAVAFLQSHPSGPIFNLSLIHI